MTLTNLHLPFTGDFPISFPFGREATDPAMAEKFREWGIIGHHGVDISLPEGTPVLACAEGTVLQSGENADWGISVTLKHSWGTSIYAHLKDTVVSVGQEIAQGAAIGYSGSTGTSFGPHLHLGIKPLESDNDNGYLGFIDPIPYLSADTSSTRREIPVEELIDEVLKKRLDSLRIKANQARQKKREKLLEEIVTLSDGQPVTNFVLRKHLRISRQTATNYLRLLTKDGHLKKLHQGRATQYEKI